MIISNEINSFFKTHGMHHEDINFEIETQKFVKHMQAGLEGLQSSLMMLPTYIYPVELPRIQKRVITIDAGGTNLRIAVVTLENGKQSVVSDFKTYRMIGSGKPATKKEFFDTIIDYIEPLLCRSDVISFCFSFPCEITSNQDGKVLFMSKEILIEGLEGCLLGEGINQVLCERGLEKKRVVVLNDTVSAMLGAIGGAQSSGAFGSIGFILGTGINSCYIDKVSNIKKIENRQTISSSDMIINTESGNYSDFPMGDIDKKFDEQTICPGRYRYEKMISGAYQGGLIFLIAKTAAREGLFSKQFMKRIEQYSPFEMLEISLFFEDTKLSPKILDLCEDDNDKTHLLEIIDMVSRRGAKLAVINIAALIIQGDSGKDESHPVDISAVGTTFYKSPNLKKYITDYTKSLIEGRLKRYCRYLDVDNGSILGTALAGLSNK